MQFQIVARGRNSASDNCCAINRSIRIQWHSVNQFLASRNTYGTFKQTGLRYSSSQFCHCVIGRVVAVFHHALHADNTRVDRGNPLSLSSPSATGLSALAPAQRAGAQRLCALAPLRHADGLCKCRLSGQNGSDRRAVGTMRWTRRGRCSTRQPPVVPAMQSILNEPYNLTGLQL